MVAHQEDAVRIAGREDLPDLVVGRLVDAVDVSSFATELVKDCIRLLELDEAEVRLELGGEIPKRLAAQPDEFAVLRDLLAVGERIVVARVVRIDAVLPDRVADVVEKPLGVTRRLLGAEKAGYHRPVELVRRMGNRCVDDDARAIVSVQQRPQRPLADVVVARHVPVVAIVPDEADRAVFAGIDAGVERRPGARRPRRNL